MRGRSGQASVEAVALLPVLVAVALAVGHLLAAGLARELAGHAAEAGAIAALHGADPDEAVAAALPEWSEDGVRTRVRGRRVSVRIEPPAVVPALGRLLASTATADAGPGVQR
jgi:hypothetical protein